MFLRAIKEPARNVSCIAADMIVTGNVVSAGAVRIDGIVHGDVHCATLSQGESGAVHGNIVAGKATLAGLVEGAVEAGALSLDPTARVTGDILYASLSITHGAQVEGRFRRSKGDADHGASAARHEAARIADPSSAQPQPAAAGQAAVNDRAAQDNAAEAAPEAQPRQRASAERTRRASTRAKLPELFAVAAGDAPEAQAAE